MSRTARCVAPLITTLALGSFTVTASTTVPGGTISTDRTWDLAGSPYIVTGSVVIQGKDGPDAVTTVTIEPGVEVRFANAGRITISGGSLSASPGALVADGDAGPTPAEILFTSHQTTPAAGDWEGLLFQAGTHPSSILRHARFQYSGRNSRAVVDAALASSTTLPITNVQFELNAHFDLNLRGGTLNVTHSTLSSVTYGTINATGLWSNNTFVNWGARRSTIKARDFGDFVSDSSFAAVANALTDLLAGSSAVNATINLDASWTGAAGELVLNDSLYVEGTDGPDGVTTLTLMPGTTLRFLNNRTLFVGQQAGSVGALAMPGGSPAVVLKPDAPAPTPGQWRGIELGTGTRDSTLADLRIEFAGATGSGAIRFNHQAPALVTLDRVELVQSGAHDLYFVGGTAIVRQSQLASVFYAGNSPTVQWSNNTFTNWGARLSRVRADDIGSFTHGGSFAGVGGAYLEVLASGAVVSRDANWGPAAGPLVTTGSLTIRGTDGADGITTLQLEPSVQLKLPNGVIAVAEDLPVTPGRLIADGTAGRITITSSQANPGPGAWTGLFVKPQGRIALREVDLLYTNVAIDVRGVVEELVRTKVNRASIGLRLQSGSSVLTTMTKYVCTNCTTALEASSTTATLRDCDLIGTSWGARNMTPTTTSVDARGNWWGAENGPSGVGPGSGSAVSAGVLYEPWRGAPADDGDGVELDDGDGLVDPCTGGNAVDCDDNCPSTPNPSQKDSDGDAVGDACDENPILTVSSALTDGADFRRIQDAVDAAFQSGTTIRILRGTGSPYLESVRLDRPQVFTIEGIPVVGPPELPVVLDGGVRPALLVLDKVGTRPTQIRSLTLRGWRGIETRVDTAIEEVKIENAADTAALATAARLSVDRCEIQNSWRGAVASAGASLELRRSRIANSGLVGAIADGSVLLENVLIHDGTEDGVRVGVAGVLTMRYTTIVQHPGVGIEVAAGGTATLQSTIAWGNAAGDATGLSCTSVSWSDLGTVSCGGTNLATDPVMTSDYRLGPSSPCLDHGPNPSLYTGTPSTDLALGLRLRDHDGDRDAESDCGAFERAPESVAVGEVQNLRFDSPTTLAWDSVFAATEYHVYRTDVALLSYSHFGTCQDAVDSNRTDLIATDLTLPAAGAGLAYLVTAEAAGQEGTLGFGTSAERSNFAPCP